MRTKGGSGKRILGKAFSIEFISVTVYFTRAVALPYGDVICKLRN